MADSTAPRARAKACIECRQSKVHCDRLDQQPEACTRCRNRNLSCIYQPRFIRTRRRPVTPRPHRSIAIQRHRHESTRDADESIAIDRHHDASNLATSSDRSRSNRLPCTNPELSSSNSTVASPHQYIQERQMNFQPISKPSITIEDITLTAGELNSYLSYFFENMHCHFPFLERPFLPPKTLSSSPLLFWTIITVSSSFPNRSLYERLQPIVRRLLASGLCPFAMSQELCQALCLLCLWPLEASDPNDDPHFMYAGMATHIAMQMGLHRPQFTHEFKQIKELGVNPHETPTSRWMTWCACIFVEHQLASKVGVPCGVRDLWALQKSLNHAHPEESPPLPSLIRHQLLLIFLRDRYLNTVSWDAPTTSGLCEPPMRLNILKLFSTELDQWESRHDMLEETTSVLLHATRVLIAGFCLAADLALVEHQTAQATILLLLHRGVDSATAVLNIVAPLAWETLPVHIIRAVRDAGVFSAQLLRIERSQPSSTASGTLLSPFRDPPSSSSSRPSTWSERSSFTGDSTLICLLDRAIDILRSVSYGRDFSTRNKILLEVLRQGATTKDAQTGGPDVESQLGHGEGVAKSNVHGNDDLRHLSAHGFIRFQARMGANIFWDAVEYGKGAHDWTQNEKDIFLEMQSELG